MYLGIDCSTQSLKLVVINDQKELIKQTIVVFDDDLPHYNTKSGVIRHKNKDTNDQLDHVGAPTVLFVEALELCLDKMINEGFDLSNIKAIAGSAQMHGTVWFKKNSKEFLEKTLKNDKNTDQLFNLMQNAFTLPLPPIWMDTSTVIECAEIANDIGSSQVLADITGSRAYERFTGAHIKHIYKYQPNVYNETERISLISSFLASLFIGDYAPIEFGDGSGMNMLNIHEKTWDQNILNIIAPNLRDKLGEAVPPDTKIGVIATYWCEKYGFIPDCEVYAFSGDNLMSVVGLELEQPGDIGITLGTSDGVLCVSDEPKPNADEGSILVHPQHTKNYILMLVYANGGITRRHLRDQLFKNDKKWIEFNNSIKNTPVGCNGHIGFYYFEKEITPNISNTGIVKFNNNNELINDSNLNESDCRSIVETQVMSYKYHAKLLGLNKISSILVTGGGSVNDEILQIIADVFETEVMQSSITNTAASGAAISAFYSYSKHHNIFNFKRDSTILNSSKIVTPNSKNYPIYRQMFTRYAKLEDVASKILNKKD